VPYSYQAHVQEEKQKEKGHSRQPNKPNTFAGYAYSQLAKHILEVETYPFKYPSLKEDLPPNFVDLDTAELQNIKGAGVKYADDFTMLSPLNLCLSTGIAPEKISALYNWSEMIIYMVHAEQKETISFIKEI
jgi:hypothetical protein